MLGGLPGTADILVIVLILFGPTGCRTARSLGSSVKEFKRRERAQKEDTPKRDDERKSSRLPLHVRPAPRLDVLARWRFSLRRSCPAALPARMLYNWDAVQFALALREYDVRSTAIPAILYVPRSAGDEWLGDPAPPTPARRRLSG